MRVRRDRAARKSVARSAGLIRKSVPVMLVVLLSDFQRGTRTTSKVVSRRLSSATSRPYFILPHQVGTTTKSGGRRSASLIV